MTAREYLKVARERWVTILVGALVGLLVGGAAAALLPTQYSATATLYFAMKGTEGADFSAYEGNLLAQQRVKSSEVLVTTERVAQDVVDHTGVDLAPGEVIGKLSAKADLDSVLLEVTADDTSPERAMQLANAAGDALARLDTALEPTPGTAPVTIVTSIVQPAQLPGPPELQDYLQFVLGGLLAGLIVGAAVAILRARFDTSLRSVSALREVAGAPVLAVTVRDGGADERPVSVTGSGGALAESARRLRVGLEHGRNGTGATTVLVTSPMATPARASTVAHLALACVHAGRTVAVVETDLRESRMESLFRLDRGPGLAGVLAGGVPLAAALQSPTPGLDVLVAGPTPGNVGELISSPATAEVLAELRRTHDIVLVDAAPILLVADALALVPSSDAVLLLCRYGASRDEVHSAVVELQDLSATVLGTVLTDVPAGRRSVEYRPDAAPVRPEPREVSEQVVVPGPRQESEAEPAETPEPAAANGAAPAPRPAPSPRPSPRRRTSSDDVRPRAAVGGQNSAS